MITILLCFDRSSDESVALSKGWPDKGWTEKGAVLWKAERRGHCWGKSKPRAMQLRQILWSAPTWWGDGPSENYAQSWIESQLRELESMGGSTVGHGRGGTCSHPPLYSRLCLRERERERERETPRYRATWENRNNERIALSSCVSHPNIKRT